VTPVIPNAWTEGSLGLLLVQFWAAPVAMGATGLSVMAASLERVGCRDGKHDDGLAARWRATVRRTPDLKDDRGGDSIFGSAPPDQNAGSERNAVGQLLCPKTEASSAGMPPKRLSFIETMSTHDKHTR